MLNSFSVKTGLWTLGLYTIILSLLGVARGSAGTPDFLQRVILVALSGFLVGYFLNPIARAIHGSGWKRFGILAILIFSLASISNVLETILYLPAVAVVGSFGGGIIQSIILAGILTRVTQPKQKNSQKEAIRIPLMRRFIFIIVLAVLWIPVYFLFVTLDTPIVHWLEQGTKDVFSHPSLVSMVGLELVRGIIHACVLLEIAFLAQGIQRKIWLWGSLAIAILNGWLPILPVSTLPLGIRIANGVEITLSSIIFAWIASYLFMKLQS